jgi:hypothetical protein
MKQYLEYSSVGGFFFEKTPFEGDILEMLCRGKAHKRLFRVTSAWGAMIVKKIAGNIIINHKVEKMIY